MKKIAILLVFCMMLCLPGCGKKAFDPAQIAQYYAAVSLSGEYTVTTHGGVYAQYRLSCEPDGDRSVVTILEPQSVAGVSAVVENGQGTLRFQDVMLEALTPAVAGFTPMDSLQGVIADLRDKLPDSVQEGQDYLILEYRDALSDRRETVKMVTLHRETLALLSAELYLDGLLMLALQMDTLPVQ